MTRAIDTAEASMIHAPIQNRRAALDDDTLRRMMAPVAVRESAAMRRIAGLSGADRVYDALTQEWRLVREIAADVEVTPQNAGSFLRNLEAEGRAECRYVVARRKDGRGGMRALQWRLPRDRAAQERQAGVSGHAGPQKQESRSAARKTGAT
jgi:hypothetical protein